MCRVHPRSEQHPVANGAHSEGRQILENWRIKRIIDAKSVENAIATLENRKERYRNQFMPWIVLIKVLAVYSRR